MSVLTTQNVRHLIVANGYDNTGATPGKFVKLIAEPDNSAFYVQYTNVLGQLIKSDRIVVNNIRKIKALAWTPRVLGQHKLEVTAVEAGQIYSVRIIFRQWGSGSQEDQYVKHIGAYKAKTGDDAADIVDALVTLGTANLSRESANYLTFAKEAVTNKLVITEVAQPWVLGKRQGRPLDYKIFLSPIIRGGVENYEWATITETPANPGNGTGHLAAEMEYFYHGEIGDTYRNNSWPNNWDTQYLVDPNANYNMLEIAYFENQTGEGVQASEKQLVVLCKDDTGVIVNLTTAINAVKAGTVTAIVDVAGG